MKYLIVGHNSEVGKQVSEQLARAGIDFATAGRHKATFHFEILNKVSNAPDVFDAVIYVSWLHSPRSRKIMTRNFEAFQNLASSLPSAKLVLISSLAAGGKPRSNYGQAKLMCEQLSLQRPGSLILRPATVTSSSRLTAGGVAKSRVAVAMVRFGGSLLSPPTIDIENLGGRILGHINSDDNGVHELVDVRNWICQSRVISLAVRALSFPISCVRLDLFDKAISFLDVKFPVQPKNLTQA